jgi:dihydrofolate reductase
MHGDMNTHNIRIVAIVAMNQSRIIGGPNGELPWPHIPEDFKHFKKETSGFPVIVGRKTQDEIVARLGKPLPGRFTSVVSREIKETYSDENMVYSTSPNEALLEAQIRARTESKEKVFVIGGASIYDSMLGLTDEIIVTKMKIELPDGPRFPQFEDIFHLKEVRYKQQEHKMDYEFQWWVRNPDDRHQVPFAIRVE